jgi:NAD-specific glutamate dehydrogenase
MEEIEIKLDENGVIINDDFTDVSGFKDLTEEEVNVKIAESNLNALRDLRNKKLARTDWMANSDVTMSNEWKTYRQELRDITNNYTSLANVVWPTEPN